MSYLDVTTLEGDAAKIEARSAIEVSALSIDRVESLGEALLDFTSIADLEALFGQNSQSTLIILRYCRLISITRIDHQHELKMSISIIKY